MVPGPLEWALRGRYLDPARILLTSGSPGEHHRAVIHRVGALQPTLVIPAHCPHRVWASQSLGEAKDKGKIEKNFGF